MGRGGKVTIGHLNFFFPVMKSQSKSNEMNHSNLHSRLPNKHQERLVVQSDVRVEAKQHVHEFHKYPSLLLQLFRG